MNEEEKKRQEEQLKKEAENLSDMEIAELANNALKEKEYELANLRKELAKLKLYSNAEEESVELPSREECINTINDSRTTNYDYAEAVVNLVDIEKQDGRPNPLGKNGEDVYKFFKETLDECAEDKSRFTSVYQARLGNDDSQIAMAYNKRN